MKIKNINIKDIYKSQLIEDIKNMDSFALVEELFVDSSGFGLPTEMALTQRQLETKMETMLKEHNNELYTFITDVGQFQLYLGIYTKTKN